MLIEQIQISNWRSFYGDNDFLVSTDSAKNVTLIRAENGVGKTSLLAAINWCFFQELPGSGEFEDPSNLVNKFAAEQDGVTQAEVVIDFSHDGKSYRAARSYDARGREAGALRLAELVDGAEIPLAQRNPDRFINSVIPKEMAPHFFFYGEATSKYTGSSGARKFGEAVKGILGSTVARMALQDLEKVRTEYNRQAADNTGSEAQAANRRIAEADEKIAGYEAELEKLANEVSEADARIDRLNRELSGAEAAKDLQARRAKLEAEFRRKEDDRSKAEARSRGWLQNYGVAVLSEELVVEASTVIREENTRRKLPAPYDQKFVKELLEDLLCVCGRTFTQGSSEYDKIKEMLETAGSQNVMSRIMSTEHALGRLEEKAKIAWTQRQRDEEQLRGLESDMRVLDADIKTISDEIASNPMSDIQEKEAARSRAKIQRSNATSRQADVLAAKKGFEQQKAAAEADQRQLTAKSEAARRFLKRSRLAEALTARLKARLETEEEAARASIEHEIDKIVQRFMRKPAAVKLDRNYQLRLYDEGGDEIPKSTGENQLLGLAFTGAIANYAKERQSRDDDILLSGTVAPLVVDSPFGHLDPVYRAGVAEFLPELARQVILLVSTSQASDVVLEKLGDKIGMEYALARHNRSAGDGKPSETIAIRGNSYDLTVYDSHFDGTRIVEVR